MKNFKYIAFLMYCCLSASSYSQVCDSMLCMGFQWTDENYKYDLNLDTPAEVFSGDSTTEARMLAEYFEEMCIPKPFIIRSGKDFEQHSHDLRQNLLADVSLSPLPVRIPLDIRITKPLDHTWCTVQGCNPNLWKT